MDLLYINCVFIVFIIYIILIVSPLCASPHDVFSKKKRKKIKYIYRVRLNNMFLFVCLIEEI